MTTAKYKEGEVLFALLPEVNHLPSYEEDPGRFFLDHTLARVCRVKVAGRSHWEVSGRPLLVVVDPDSISHPVYLVRFLVEEEAKAAMPEKFPPVTCDLREMVQVAEYSMNPDPAVLVREAVDRLLAMRARYTQSIAAMRRLLPAAAPGDGRVVVEKGM